MVRERSNMKIAVYAEGPTEWYAMYRLFERGILNGAELFGDRNNISEWLKNDGAQAVNALRGLPEGIEGVLLLYDVEAKSSTNDVAKRIFASVGNFQNISDNIYYTISSGRKIVLHLSTEKGPGGNKDFDGYLVKLIHSLGDKAVRLWFEMEEMPAYMNVWRESNKVSYGAIHNLGAQKIPELMTKECWSIFMSKGILYSYITSLQLNKSHVWFGEKLIQHAPQDQLKSIFTSIIEAWDLLTREED